MGKISVEYGRYSVPGEQQSISKARAQKPVSPHSQGLQVLHYFAEEAKEREGRRGGGRGGRRKKEGKTGSCRWPATGLGVRLRIGTVG